MRETVGLETSILTLGQAIATAAIRAWLPRLPGRSSDAPLTQIVEDEVRDPFERRRLNRALEQVTDTIADRLMRDTELSALPENERQAAVLAVSESFEAAALTKEDFLTAAMNASDLAKVVRTRSRKVAARAGLSDEARAFYEAMIGESCSVLVAAVSAVPGWESQATAYLLRRQADLVDAVAAALEKLPSSSADAENDLSTRYVQAVINAHDRVEFTGFPVSAVNDLRLSDTFVRPDISIDRSRQPLDWALADHPRLILHGAAGSGKTSTLLWLAINAARGSLDGLSRSLNDTLPIYVSLKRAAEIKVRPQADAAYLGHVAVPPPEPSLVKRSCEAGSALVLIDGIDEVDPRGREMWLNWLAQTVERYPDCRFVVTSRTFSFDVEPLAEQRFATARIEPFDNRSKTALVRQWFAAVDRASRETPDSAHVDRLTRLIEGDSRLDDLATTPLMCTLMCALYRERGELPLRGADVYGEFVDMMVERRDAVRGIAGADELPKPEAIMLLQELARHMVGNGVTELSRDTAYKIMERELPSFARLAVPPGPALDHLIRRSGLLVEPAVGRTRFVHRTLQEYMAARSFVENDDINILVHQAHDPAWRSTVVLAAAQAAPRQGDRLIRDLLGRSNEADERTTVLAAVIQECVTAMVRLDPQLRKACERLWQQEASSHRSVIVVRLPAGDAGDDLHQWLIHDLRQGDPVVVTRIRNELNRSTLIIAGIRPPDPTEVIKAILQWYRRRPHDDRPKVGLEVEGVRVDLRPAQGIE